MAITENTIGTDEGIDEVTTWSTTTSFAPTGDRLVVAVVGIGDEQVENIDDFAMTGGGMTTWRPLFPRIQVGGGGVLGAQVFYAMQSSPGSGTLSQTWNGGVTIDAITISMFEFAGVNTSGSNAAHAIRAFVANKIGSTSTSFAAPLHDLGATANGVMSAVLIPVDETISVLSGYSLIHDIGAQGGAGGDIARTMTSWRDDNATTYGGSWTSEIDTLAIAFEIVEASEQDANSPSGELDNLYVSFSQDNLIKGTATSAPSHTVLGIPEGSFAASTKYLLVSRALFSYEDVSRLMKVHMETADDTDIALKSRTVTEFNDAGITHLQKLAYEFPHSYTTGTSPASLSLEAEPGGTGDETEFTGVSLWLLALTAENGLATEGTDYYEDIQVSEPDIEANEYSTSAQTTVLAQLSGSDLGTDTHLILGCARVHVGSGGRWYNHEVFGCDNEATAVRMHFHQAEGEDTAEERVTGFVFRHQASSGTPNVTIYGQEEAGNANMRDGGAYLIALPATVFLDSLDDYDHVAAGIAANGETTVASVGAFTPTTAGPHMVFGMIHNIFGTIGLTQLWVEDGTTEIRPADSTPSQTQNWDTTNDKQASLTMQKYDISGSTTLNLQADRNAAASNVAGRHLVVASLVLAAAGPKPHPRRQSPHVRM